MKKVGMILKVGFLGLVIFSSILMFTNLCVVNGTARFTDIEIGFLAQLLAVYAGIVAIRRIIRIIRKKEREEEEVRTVDYHKELVERQEEIIGSLKTKIDVLTMKIEQQLEKLEFGA